jgi:hypothetical protein
MMVVIIFYSFFRRLYFLVSAMYYDDGHKSRLSDKETHSAARNKSFCGVLVPLFLYKYVALEEEADGHSRVI